jgi:hypothetical protein
MRSTSCPERRYAASEITDPLLTLLAHTYSCPFVCEYISHRALYAWIHRALIPHPFVVQDNSLHAHFIELIERCSLLL